MNTLFLESSHHLNFGLLNKDLDWVDFRTVFNKKGSSVLHTGLHRLLEDHRLDARRIDRIVLGNGPGSYTGIRLSEGLAQIFKWHDTPVVSFYSFEIPPLAGIETGVWCAPAFKGEVFLHRWKNRASRLVKIDQFAAVQGSLYSNQDALFGRPTVNAIDLLKNRPRPVFKKVFARQKHLPPFYFRSLEREFQAPR